MNKKQFIKYAKSLKSMQSYEIIEKNNNINVGVIHAKRRFRDGTYWKSIELSNNSDHKMVGKE